MSLSRIKHYLISGRVQGVGFRAYAQRAGREIGVSGWVRNLEDGRVEAMAKGPEESLEEFGRRLRHGPSRGLVTAMSVEDWSSDEEFNGFEVRKDGEEPCCKD